MKNEEIAMDEPAPREVDFDPLTGHVERGHQAHCGGLDTVWARFFAEVDAKRRRRELEDRARVAGRRRR